MSTALASASRMLQTIIAARQASHAAAQVALFQAVAMACNLLTGILTARLLGPEGRGELAAMIIWPQLFAMVFGLGLPTALVYYLRANERAADAITVTGLVLGLALSLIATVAGFLYVPGAVAGYGPEVQAFALVCVGFTVVNLMTMALRPVFLVRGDYLTYNLSFYASPLTYLLLLSAWWLTVGLDPERAALGMILSGVPLLGWMAYHTLRPIRSWRPPLGDWSRRIGSYCLRLGPAEIVAALVSHLDRIVLISLVPPAVLGWYVVAFSLSRTVLIVQVAVVSVALPAMSGRTPAEVELRLGHAFRFALHALIATVGGLLVLGEAVLLVFYGTAFSGAVSTFRILVVEAALVCLSQLVAQAYFALGRPGLVSIGDVFTIAIALVLIYRLVPVLGADGAALAMLIAALFRLGFALAGLRLGLRIALPRPWLIAADLAYLRSRL